MRQKEIRISVRYKKREKPQEPCVTEWLITAIPPKEGFSYYGTGYYLSAVPIKEDGTPDHDASVYWDMRYAATTNIYKMADYWIRDYYGGTVTRKIEYDVKE